MIQKSSAGPKQIDTAIGIKQILINLSIGFLKVFPLRGGSATFYRSGLIAAVRCRNGQALLANPVNNLNELVEVSWGG